MRVHARVQALLNVFLKGVGRKRHDWNCLRVLALDFAQEARAFDSAHYRHHYVHQHKVKEAFLAFGEPIQRDQTVFGDGDFHAVLLKDAARNFLVERVVFHQKNLFSGKVDKLPFFLFLNGSFVADVRFKHFKVYVNRKCGSFARRRVALDCSAHKLNQIAYDGKAQACSLLVD